MYMQPSPNSDGVFFNGLLGYPATRHAFVTPMPSTSSVGQRHTHRQGTAGTRECRLLSRFGTLSIRCPIVTEIERRNRALIAFTLLTGARDSAMASMKLKHIDLAADSIDQDAREVNTKFSKTFTTFFFPVGDDIRRIVVEWVLYLRQNKLWGNDDPLFPSTCITLGAARQFEASGVERRHWRSASPIRAVFHEAFVGAGLPYFNPHSLRNTLVQLGQHVCRSPEEFKAWSQNLGHEKVLVTFTSYGDVSCQQQGRIIRDLARPREAAPSDANQIADAVVRKLRDSGVNTGG